MSTNRMARVGIIAGSTIAALSLAGFASATVASAADGTPSPSASQSATAHAPHARVAEEALTGATADRVKAAVLAKYPGATVDRMEKDFRSPTGYVAFIKKADGTRALVKVDANFAVTGEAGRGDKGPKDAKVPGAYGARGGHHGHASGSASSATRGPAA